MKNWVKRYLFCFLSVMIFMNFFMAHCLADEKIIKIVITGGGCAGKTTSLPFVKEYFDNKGYDVHIVNEVAAGLLLDNDFKNLVPVRAQLGYDCKNEESIRYKFQYLVAKKQIEEEDKLISEIRRASSPKKCSLLICDRGLPDGRAFMKETDFLKILESLGKNEKEILNRYDAVFHMTPTSKWSKDYYINGKLRKENAEATNEIDNRLLEIYSAHQYRRIIDPFPSMGEKIQQLIKEIQSFLEFYRS